MNFKKFSIGNHLFGGFSVLIISILFLSIVAYQQGQILHKQTDDIYHHSIVVRRAMAEIETGVALMRISTRDFLLAKNTIQEQKALLDGAKAEQAVERNFKLVFDAYLGSKSDIDAVYESFRLWNAARQINHTLAKQDKIEEVKQRLSDEGNVGILRNDMLKKIAIISNYAKNKADSFYNESLEVANRLFIELLLSSLMIIGFTLAVSFYLFKKIRLPLKELESIVSAYRAGNLDVRSKNKTGNEIGTLAFAFNDLLDNVASEKIISSKISRISDAMLLDDNSHSFFRNLLPVMISETNSQIAAVYVLNESKSEFYCYESVGLNFESINQSFSTTNFEGEFGAALATKKMQFVRNIPLDTVYTFKTVSGDIIPREMVTIPILVGNEVVAMVSIAGLRSYPIQSIDLFYKIYDILSARIAGVLAARKIRKTATRLQQQNIELEQQRNELNQQSNELSQQNGELEIQKNQLKEANRLKTSFLSNMSHELRTPLNSVIALSGVLNRRLQNAIPEDEYSYIGVIERNGRHLLSLINDILDISRIEAGREEVEINEFDVNDAVAEVVEMIQQQAVDRKNILLHHKSEKKVMLQSDSKKVRHILQNLIANAVKFTENGSVEVFLTNADSKVYIRIKDTGIGIPEEHLHHIFDEFRQADSSTSRRFGGTGLGLAIARKYARLLGGEITVTSEPDKGSEFTIVLPEKAGDKVQIQQIDPIFDTSLKVNHSSVANQSQQNKLGKAKSILLVEDSEPAIVQLKDMLESSDYVVTAARSGAEALQLLTHFMPDAMILDLQMPKMDGFELLDKIRNFDKTKDVPVLILTAKHITKDDIQFLKNNNIHQLIQKGDVQREALLHAVYTMVATPIEDAKHSDSRDAKHTDLIDAKYCDSNSKQTVLIVEDNIDNMTTVKAVIGERFVMLEAVDGIEAVEMAQKHVPDFILMDIALPELDGIQAFKQIRLNPRLMHIPVIALTASAMLSERETILAYGFDAYIPKPIDEKQFFEIINHVMYGK